jgi:chitinase
MKIKFTKKAAVRIAAILMMLTFYGCISASPNIKRDLKSSANSIVQSGTTTEIKSSGQPNPGKSTGSSQNALNASSLFRQGPSSWVSSIPNRIFSSSQLSSSLPVQSTMSQAKTGTSSAPAISKSSNSSSSSSSQASSQSVYVTQSAFGQKYVVGYYPAWARYSGFTPDKIDAKKLTHIHYAFADISPDLKLTMTEGSADLQNFAALRNLRSKNPSLKLIISVGGWDNSKYFSDAAATTSSRETFSQSCLNFILSNGLDGIDLDWEYPVSGGVAGNIHRSQDKQNLTKLVQAIRQKLNAQTAKDGKRYFLTMTGAPDTSFINKIELTSLLPSLDYLFIMGYDLHGSWDDYADFNAPLYTPTEPSPQYKVSVNQGISAYLNAGASPKKLVLGVPFYGYCYEGVSSANHGLYSTFTSAKSIGHDSIVSKYLSNPAFTSYTHSTAMVPYLYGNNTFISYENPQSIAQKAALAKQRGLLGVGAWELSFDRSAVLLTSEYNAFQ